MADDFPRRRFRHGIDREIENSFEIKLLGLRFRASAFLAVQRKLLPARFAALATASRERG